jgi:poly(3-hydroxybutyrate) depolymerase
MTTADTPRRPIPIYGGPGPTSFFASRVDQRFSYCMYVPRDYDELADDTYPLFVVVHGSLRNAEGYRDRLADWAEQQQCIVLAPLFPNSIIEPGEANNYKEIRFHDIRFDHILLGMIDEVAETYRVQNERFMLYGYSGGGQFAHRFYYLHPQRLRAVSIGAPGAVTLLDTTQPWWLGVADIEELFGVQLDLQALRSVSVQLLVGGNDTEPMEAIDSLRTMPGSERAGATRVERLATLRDSLTENGIAVEHAVLPGLGHENYKFLPAVTDFFTRVMAQDRR